MSEQHCPIHGAKMARDAAAACESYKCPDCTRRDEEMVSSNTLEERVAALEAAVETLQSQFTKILEALAKRG